jgi:xylulokinase
LAIVAEYRSVGGAARSELWRQIKADVLNCTVVTTSYAEPTSLEDALLATTAAQEVGKKQLCSRWVDTFPPNRPESHAHDLYQKL